MQNDITELDVQVQVEDEVAAIEIRMLDRIETIGLKSAQG